MNNEPKIKKAKRNSVMNELSLFTGGGIGILAARNAGINTVVMCENDPCCQFALQKLWPDIKLFTDVRSVAKESLSGLGTIDLISGGFPCQNISTAGKGEGIHGEKSGLWFQMLRIIDEVRPPWILIENVPALRMRGSDIVLSGLEKLGYTCWPVVVGAWAVGATHKRDRVWIVAHCPREQREERAKRDGVRESSQPDCDVDCTTSTRCTRRAESGTKQASRHETCEFSGSSSVMADASNDYRRGGINTKEEGIGPQKFRRRGLASGSVGKLANTADMRRKKSVIERMSGGIELEAHAATETHETNTARWPSRPGERQHDWEAPRITQCGVGCSVDGIPSRVHTRANKSMLRILGNSWVFQIPEMIYRWIVEMDKKGF